MKLINEFPCHKNDSSFSSFGHNETWVNDFLLRCLKQQQRFGQRIHHARANVVLKLRFSFASGSPAISHIFVLLSIHTTHAAIFRATPFNPLNRCSTTIFIYRKYVRTESMFCVWCVSMVNVCLYVLALAAHIHWCWCAHSSWIASGIPGIESVTEKEGKKEEAKNSEWNEYVRNEAILRLVLEKFLSTKEFDCEQTF